MMTSHTFSVLMSARWQVLPAMLLLSSLMMTGPLRSEEAGLWRMLAKSEVFAIMRHAIAPGTGDPAAFRLDDCATQRNLSEEGRAQARRAGELFRQNGVTVAAVFSSQWCRCRETAELLKLGPVLDLVALNSFFGKYERRPHQTCDLKDWLGNLPDDRPHVLVTHQVNISALLGRGARTGEIIFVRRTEDGGLQIEVSIIP